MPCTFKSAVYVSFVIVIGCFEQQLPAPKSETPIVSPKSDLKHPSELVGIWQWTANSPEPSYYVLRQDGVVVGYTGRRKDALEGTWFVDDGQLHIVDSTDDLRLCYRLYGKSGIKQIYHVRHGKKKEVTDDPAFVKVESME